MRDTPYQDYADQRYYGVGSGRFGTVDLDPSGRFVRHYRSERG